LFGFYLSKTHTRCRRQRALFFIGGRKFSIFSLLTNQRNLLNGVIILGVLKMKKEAWNEILLNFEVTANLLQLT